MLNLLIIMVNAVNEELRNHLSNSRVIIVSQNDRNSSHLHDGKDITRNKGQGELLSAIQLFDTNLFESLNKQFMDQIQMHKIL